MLLCSICYLVFLGVTYKKSARNLKICARFQDFKILRNGDFAPPWQKREKNEKFSIAEPGALAPRLQHYTAKIWIGWQDQERCLLLGLGTPIDFSKILKYSIYEVIFHIPTITNKVLQAQSWFSPFFSLSWGRIWALLMLKLCLFSTDLSLLMLIKRMLIKKKACILTRNLTILTIPMIILYIMYIVKFQGGLK